jgi:hypothetical protein
LVEAAHRQNSAAVAIKFSLCSTEMAAMVVASKLIRVAETMQLTPAMSQSYSSASSFDHDMESECRQE